MLKVFTGMENVGSFDVDQLNKGVLIFSLHNSNLDAESKNCEQALSTKIPYDTEFKDFHD